MSETYWALVETAAQQHPDRVVLVDDYGRSLTNEQLRAAAMRTAASLAERGVGQGTIVSWQLPTTLETMVVMVALTRLGAIQNPILPIWRESEVRFVTSQLGTEVLIVPGTWRGFDHVALADDAGRRARVHSRRRRPRPAHHGHRAAPARRGCRAAARACEFGH